MMTATFPIRSSVSTDATLTQNETGVTEMEVFRRARNIRMGWTATEKVIRRAEADRRFSDLLDALFAPTETA